MTESSLAVGALVVVAGAGVFALAFFFVIVVKKLRLSTPVIRAVGLVLVVVAVCALALATQSNVTAAVGVLGAVAGYLFGAASSGESSSVSAGDVGDGNTIVGRDLNQTVEQLKAEAVNLTQAVGRLHAEADERKPAGTVVIELVTRRLSWTSDEEYLDALQSVILQQTASGGWLLTSAGPYDSHNNDFSSTVLVFGIDRPGVTTRKISAPGVHLAAENDPPHLGR